MRFAQRQNAQVSSACRFVQLWPEFVLVVGDDAQWLRSACDLGCPESGNNEHRAW